MDTTQGWTGNPDDNFDALDFGDESGSYDSGAVLDFGDEAGTGSAEQGEQSVLDALDDDEPAEFHETGTEPRPSDILLEDTGDTEDTDGADDHESPWTLTTVTNPPETVSVTATMNGTIHNVELSANAARMTESELAAEILVIADLARRQASSNLHTMLLEEAAEAMKALGVDDDGTLADRLENGLLRLSSPEQAVEAQAQVFATRYTGDDDRSPGR